MADFDVVELNEMTTSEDASSILDASGDASEKKITGGTILKGLGVVAAGGLALGLTTTIGSRIGEAICDAGEVAAASIKGAVDASKAKRAAQKARRQAEKEAKKSKGEIPTSEAGKEVLKKG